MPHLDAGALSVDPEGLEFLKSVLDTAGERPPRSCFNIPAPGPVQDRDATFGRISTKVCVEDRVPEPA